MRVAADLPQGRRIDEIDPAAHQLDQGLLRAFVGKLAEQLCIVGHPVFSTRPTAKTHSNFQEPVGLASNHPRSKLRGIEDKL